MNIAEQAMAGGYLGFTLDLLNRQRPQPGQKDLRGWEWRYLWQQTRSDALFTLCRKSEIESLAVSADGRWLAIGLVHKGGVSVYDLQTRQQVANLVADETHERVAFSPTEPLLAFSSSNVSDPSKIRSTLHLWNVATRQMVAEFPLENEEVALAFSQDGRTLLTFTDHITLLSVPDGAKLASYPCPQRRYYFEGTTFATTPDLRLAAYSLPNGSIRVIDLRDGRELWVSAPAGELITSLAMSPDGKTLASGYGWTPSDIRLWDLATGRETGRLTHQNSWIGSLVFWPDGKKLATCSGDQTIRIWDLASETCTDVLRGHRLEVMRLALLPDGKTLVSGGKDGEVCLWDTSVMHPRQQRITLPEIVGMTPNAGNSVGWRFAPDSQSLLAVNTKGQLARWNGPDFQQKETILEIGTDWSYSLISQDGRFLAVGSGAGEIRVWDVERRVLLHRLTAAAGEAFPIRLLAGGSRLLTSAIPGESLIERIHEWDLTSGVEIQSWQGPAYSVVWTSPDERYCLAESNGDGVRRDLAGKTSTIFHTDSLEESQGVFSPDGKLLAISSDLGYARVFDAATLRPLVTLPGFFFGVHGAAFSSDGQRLLTCTDGQAGLRLWATDSWQNVLTLDGNGISHLMGGGVASSPDGNVVSWLGSDGQLYLWRAPSWAEINATEGAQSQNPPTP